MATPRFIGCIQLCQSHSGETKQWRLENERIKQQTNFCRESAKPYRHHVRDRKDGNGFWTRIGSAWQHADGKGFNIQIDTAPLDGRISLRIPSEKTQ
jgi:hypothetical protein